ncbi:integrator complex subunit 5-like protein [Ochlerotatus camptorhynchus]|uniref:integrator complex subunit 5-like protein n=1 Tax=Ochlerotatus camptorhynchus TaxID=644619 RepID=UPI0031D93169
MHSKGTSTAATATTTVTTTPTTISTTFNSVNAAVINNMNNNNNNNNSYQNYNYNNNINNNSAITNPNVPVAFVEFKDVASAAAAMCALQGKYLLSSDRGAMRIEFAKSKMAADVPSHHFYHLHMQQREGSGYGAKNGTPFGEEE